LRTGEYYSKGKLLISGEYLVLQGAKALSVPLKFGQGMKVTETTNPGVILWETHVMDKPWFRAEFHGSDLEIREASNNRKAFFIRQLLKAGLKYQPGFFPGKDGCCIQNRINFDLEWGLGSSSSLVSNLAHWFDVDLFSFYRESFDGSGFDVFSARADTPVIYQLVGDVPVVEKTKLHPSVAEHLYFVYLGQKQDSQESVRIFKERAVPDPVLIRAVSDLTLEMIAADDPVYFMDLMRQHESLVSGILGRPTARQLMFPGFKGEIKSLGAWGGDFIMACTFLSPGEVRSYFKEQKLDVVFSWNDIVY
jgi:hypothetical protein